MSCPVLGFSRRETFLFDVRLGRIASLVFDPPNSTAEPRRVSSVRSTASAPRRTRPKAWQASMQCQRVTAELHMQARRSRTSFAGQRHAPHPSAMARRAAAALHKGDSSARSFPAALHDIKPRWLPLATELSIPVEQLGGGLKRQISCTSFCKGLHDPFVKHFPARPRPRHAMHLTRLPLFLDSLCVADSFSPDRFDLQSSQAPYGLDLVARSVLLSSTARDVGALAPPARSTEDIRRAGCLAATSNASWREVPSLLRASTGASAGTAPAACVHEHVVCLACAHVVILCSWSCGQSCESF